MKLEKFSKNKRQRKIIVGSIVGILLLIGSIVLIRSYALYAENKEFNVLKGQIPDFGYDIKMLSVVVDGEKSKTIPSRGLYKTQIDCSNGTIGKWDYNTWNLTLENVSENARCNITFTSNLSEEEYNKYIEAGKTLRRNTYRGKDITSYYNDGSLYEMISSGRFDDIYVGDYIVANNIKWLVADIDNYLYSGYKEGAINNGYLKQHHVTIIPSGTLSISTMNETNTTEGGYYNSKMKQKTLTNILDTYVKPVFENHILTYYTFLSMQTDDILNIGKAEASKADWVSSQIDLMSETNVYGTIIWSSSGYDIGIDNRQYALFQLKPEFVTSEPETGLNMSFWLKNIYDSEKFIVAESASHAGLYNAKSTKGIRPRFLIG